MNFTRTELEKLEIFISKRFGSQKNFAEHIGYSEEGLSKSLTKSRKKMQGRLSSRIINTMKGAGISITVELSDDFIQKLLTEQETNNIAAEPVAPYGKLVEKLDEKDKEIKRLKEKLKKTLGTQKPRVRSA